MEIFILSLIASLYTCALASDVPHIRGRNFEAAVAQRGVCNADNVLRALRANSASASTFCSSFINIPGATVFKSVHGVTATTTTETVTAITTLVPNFPNLPLPSYVTQYNPSRVSSACSCLSVPTSTSTVTASTSTVTTDTTVYKTATATGTCATGTVYPGGHLVTGQFADAYNYSMTTDPYMCCDLCNSGFEGPYASCVAWAYLGDGLCTSVLEGPPFADYKQPYCAHDGLQPGTIYVDQAKYPLDIGGKGQCASTLTVVNG